ncbi:MAG: uroporphyrinogen-III C-methyltransferase [Burkholderiales bacterium]|nr:uroporphyrinogen-III C-methyltransferase [Burkholderiales bacterium]
MTESNTDSAQPAAEPIPPAEPVSAPPPEEPSGRNEREPAAGTWRLPVLLVLLVAIAAVGWQWYDTRSRIESIREEIAQRLRASDSSADESRVLAKQALEGLRETQSKLSVLENKIVESQSQQVALESLYQDLSRNRDEWALAEIEQMLTLASQQLQLAGNVQAALLALRTAEGRLARSDRPQFVALRRVLNRDIERLKAAPNVDITGMALRLDHLISHVDTLPLHFDTRMQATPNPVGPAGAGADWRRVLAEVWGELKQLVRIRIVDKPDAALLAPEQAYFLRQNLQLRLLDARQALLVRDPERFRADLETAQTWIKRYYDGDAKSIVNALTTLKQLAAASIDVETPNIDDSLAAVRNFKVSHEKAQR